MFWEWVAIFAGTVAFVGVVMLVIVVAARAGTRRPRHQAEVPKPSGADEERAA
jgi:hypothetical protein